MPKDIKTNVIVSYETKGLNETSQQAAKFSKDAAQASKEQSKYYAEAAKHLERVMRGTERARQAAEKHYQSIRSERKKQTEEEKAARRASSRAEAEEYQKQRRLRRQAENEQYQSQRAAQRQLQADEKQRKQAFTQGLLQGGLPFPAPFLQRGPGMWRQMGGMAVGRGARSLLGVGQGLAGAGLSGISGVQQALSSIPVVGGAMAGQVGIAASFTQQFMQQQQAQLAAAPYTVNPQRLAAAQSYSARQKRAQAEYEQTQARLEKAEMDLERAEGFKAIGDEYGDWKKFVRTPGARKGIQKQLSGKNIRKLQRQRDNLAQETAKKKQAMEGMGVKSITEGMESLSSLGLGLLGVNKTEALQAATAIVQAGGGRMKEARDNQAIRLGFAAQTAYGVQSETAGAFLRGGRRGGLVGARGRGGEAMVEAIQDGLRLGLEGSELNTYLQTIASGIQQFEQTGIPVAQASIAGMSQAFGSGGVIGGDRAARLGAGLTQYAQTIGTRGIKGGMDLMMLQMLGGYQGGGSEDLQKAFINMEQMRGTLQGQNGATIKTEDATGDMLRRIIELGGGGAGGEMMMRSMLARMGIQMGHAEARLLGARLTGGTLSEDEQAAADAEMARKVSLAGEAGTIGTRRGGRITGLGDMAKGMVSRTAGTLKAQKQIENRQIDVGRRMASSVQTLQRAALNTNEAFTKLVDGPLKNFAKWMEKITGQAKELATALGASPIG